ncbi:hypothetical protein [Bdellovibrio bacteriovorus]|uniref:hypothetical protein n=1 Tax=Bdellovibrio bacteriovorus TaxID=959 RepID=UPI0035A5AECC
MVHPFLKLRQNRPKEIKYAHPKLEPILEKTMGVPIFQEQVMKMVVAVADFTPGEADELRRVMSSAWKRKATMGGIEQRLRTGFARHGISSEYADQIYKTIEGFANYGFPRKPLGQLCAFDLCQLLSEMPLSGCVCLRAFEQSAHGLLRSPHDHRRSPA